MLVETLRNNLEEIFKEHSFQDIDTDFSSHQIKNGLGFFPYGSGTLTTKKEIPEKCYLFLGHDFGSVEYANRIKETGEVKEPTLRILLKEIIDEEYKEQVFLSNVLMGLRKGEKSNIKKFPPFENKEYQQLCIEFLKFQIDNLKPFRIITLGEKTERFIQQHLNNINTFNIPHPSFLYPNLKRSKKWNSTEDIKSYVFDYAN